MLQILDCPQLKKLIIGENAFGNSQDTQIIEGSLTLLSEYDPIGSFVELPSLENFVFDNYACSNMVSVNATMVGNPIATTHILDDYSFTNLKNYYGDSWNNRFD